MKAAVTGASGFIGRRLVTRLLNEGWSLRVLTRNTANLDASIRKKVEIVEGDIRDEEKINALCQDREIIFHLAANVHNYGDKVQQYHEVNVEGSRALLKAALHCGVNKIVYFSSCKADESGAYGTSKKEAETLLLNAAKQGKIAVCCLRPAAVYGPGMKSNLLLWMKLINKGMALPVPLNAGKLSLVGLEDLCEAAVSAGQKEIANDKIYPLADEQAYDVKTVENALRKALGKKPIAFGLPRAVFYMGAAIGEVLSVLGMRNPGMKAYRALFCQQEIDSTLIREELGLQARQNLYQELERIIDLAEA